MKVEKIKKKNKEVFGTRLDDVPAKMLKQAAKILGRTPSDLLREAWADFVTYNKIPQMIEAEAQRKAEARAKRRAKNGNGGN